MNTNPSWSYSSLTAFETCPRRYYLTRVVPKEERIVEPQTEATTWGNEVHKAFEKRIRYKTPFPQYLVRYESLIGKLETTPGQLTAETKQALTKDFKPTSWMGKDVWVRSIADVTHRAGRVSFVGDWKTGKPKPESAQLKLAAAFEFHQQPAVEVVKTAFFWLKTNTMNEDNKPVVFRREDLPKIWGEFLPRYQRLQNAYSLAKWPAKPSGLCEKWCPVTRKHCEFSGQK